MTKSVAIITARGGSKRIPRKNIKDFMGKPIIAYSIEAALSAGIFDEVMVSTDDDEIADVAKKYGATIPFLRSRNTSDDISNTNDVLKEVLSVYETMRKDYKYACCLYPTAPFVTADRLIVAFKMLKESGADSVIPVTEFSFPILRSFNMDKNTKIAFNWPENATVRSQDLAPAYHDCGQYYFFDVKKFLANGKLVSDNTLGVVTSSLEVQDIDNEDDWKLAEVKYSFIEQQKILKGH
jgi:pseudaminic acid cytidylyltransferase